MTAPQQNRLIRIINLLRYLRRYGPVATYLYARYLVAAGRKYKALPTIARKNDRAHVGILGCGRYSFTTICHYLRSNYGNVIHGVANRTVQKAIDLANFYEANYYTTDFDRVISDNAINLIFVATNNSSHAEYAIEALNRGKAVHIEKPPVVSRDQLNRLREAMSRTNGVVNWGYCRPGSKIGQKISEVLARESGPIMIDWFIAAHVSKLSGWGQAPEEGGFFLSHMCHFIDYTLSLIPETARFPARIHPCLSANYPDALILSYEFADGSLACISGSTKGEIFKGLSEHLNISRGEATITMHDFHHLTVRVGTSTRAFRSLFEDVGHQNNIMQSYSYSRRVGKMEREGLSIKTVWESCDLLLLSQEALRTGKTITALGYDVVHRIGS